VLLQVQDAISPAEESPTQFEVITAAAWLYFAESKVAVVVGLGGRLDATNVCDARLSVSLPPSAGNTGSNWGQRWQILLGRKPVSSNLGVQLCGTTTTSSCWCDRVLLSWAAQLFGLNRRQKSQVRGIRRERRGGRHVRVLNALPLLGQCNWSNSALAIAACKSSNSWVGIYRKRSLPVWQN